MLKRIKMRTTIKMNMTMKALTISHKRQMNLIDYKIKERRNSSSIFEKKTKECKKKMILTTVKSVLKD